MHLHLNVIAEFTTSYFEGTLWSLLTKRLLKANVWKNFRPPLFTSMFASGETLGGKLLAWRPL